MATLYEQVKAFKKSVVEGALKQAGGNRSHAAALLGLQRTYLHRLLRELEIQVPPRGPRYCRKCGVDFAIHDGDGGCAEAQVRQFDAMAAAR
jgi:hypothetical protein